MPGPEFGRIWSSIIVDSATVFGPHQNSNCDLHSRSPTLQLFTAPPPAKCCGLFQHNAAVSSSTMLRSLPALCCGLFQHNAAVSSSTMLRSLPAQCCGLFQHYAAVSSSTMLHSAPAQYYGLLQHNATVSSSTMLHSAPAQCCYSAPAQCCYSQLKIEVVASMILADYGRRE